jgi:hypothetical protein
MNPPADLFDVDLRKLKKKATTCLLRDLAIKFSGLIPLCLCTNMQCVMRIY